jgi:hypothetical protein
MEQLEQEIYDLWSELEPALAYQCGRSEKAGEFFNSTNENIQRVMDKIDELRADTIDSVNHAVLNNLESCLKFEEPFTILWKSIWAYFSYLTKEGISETNMSNLTKNLITALKSTSNRLNSKSWSTEIKILTINNYYGLLGIIDSIEKSAPNLKIVFDELRAELKNYMKKYLVPGIKNGDFSEVYPILEAKGGNIGRKDKYPDILRNIWAYPETPMEIESQALVWLNEERPKLIEITNKLAKQLGTNPTVEAVSKATVKQQGIRQKDVLDFIKKLREPLRKVIEDNIVRITPKYETKVMETPEYLLNLITTAAMTPFDIHTEDPFNIFHVTTDEKRSPPTCVSDLFQLIVHEEFGHCVHFSNSATKFKAKPSEIAMVYTQIALPVSDGISFFREWESLLLIKKLLTKHNSELTATEKELLEILTLNSDLENFMLELEFTIIRWRIIRFLRAIGDVRINMHNQTATEFINWASEYTGLSKKFIFDQIFSFQVRPGYAPCYSIAGNRIRQLQLKAKERGRSEIDFNTYAASLGFLPRNVFEQKLNDF